VSAAGIKAKFPSQSQVLVLSQNGTWTNHLTANSDQLFDVSSLTADQAALVPEIATAWYLLNKLISPLSITTANSSSPSSVTVLRTNHQSQIFNSAFDAIAMSKGYKVMIVNQDSNLKDSKFQNDLMTSTGGGVSLIVSPFCDKMNRHFFRLLKPNGTVVTMNGLKIPSYQEVNQSGGGIEGPTTKLIFQNHQIKGFCFASLAIHEPCRAQEAIDGAVQFLLTQDQGKGEQMMKMIKKFSEEKVLEAVVSAEAGDAVVLTIH
jgi:hypothetical protein